MSSLYIGCYDKAEVLAALYNAADKPGKPYNQNPMSIEHASSILRYTPTQVFTIVEGRKLFIDLSATHLDTFSYNSENGGPDTDTAEKAIAELKKMA